MKNITLFLLSIFLLLLGTYRGIAQIRIGGTQGLKIKITPKKVLDSSYLRVYYAMDYLSDSEKPLKMKHADTFLQVGKKISRFMDYNRFRVDSVNDASVKAGKSSVLVMNAMMNLFSKVNLSNNIIMGYPKDKITFQRTVFMKDYEYKEAMPQFNWSLIQGDTIIKGYQCKKAACTYRGRDYIAWYAKKIDLPLGPYVFRGLPGLIFQIKDTKGHYIFSLSGLEEVKKYDPIYLWTSKIIPSTRKRVRNIYKSYCLYPAKALMNSGKHIKISDKDLASIKPKPYNPIELE